MPVETAEPPPTTSAPPEKIARLTALFDIPNDLVDAPDPAMPPAKESTPPPAKEPEKQPVAAPDAKPAEPTKDAVTSRLAPDFSKKADDPASPAAAPDAELADLEQAIKDAPTEKARVDLGRFRDQLKSAKEEVRQLKARPPAPAEDPQTPTLIAELTKERDELLGKVERYNLLDSPKFQKEFIQPRQKAFQTAESIVKEAGGDAALLQRAMALGGKARTELLDEIRESIPSEMMKGRFDRQIEAIDAKTAEINEKLADSKRALEESRRDETVQTHEQRQKQVKQLEGLLGSALSDLEENLGLAVLKKTGKPEFQWHDDNVDKIKALAKEIYLDATPEKAAYASVAAAAFDTVYAWWEAERQANQAKDQIIAELRGAEPSITAERQAAKVDGDASDAESITARLRDGAYRK